MGDKEPVLGIFCNQTRITIVGLGHQHRHKTFKLLFVLPGKYTGVMETQDL